MRIRYFLLIITAMGCNKQPYSKDYIYTKFDDRLSLQGKVDILRKSASVNDDALLTSIALLYAQNKNWIEAKTAISKAIKLNPLNASYHVYLANFNAELNNNMEAYEEAKVAFELGVYDKKLELLLARMSVETADTLGSNGFVTTYYLANRQNMEAQLLMARLYLMQKKYAKAKNLIQVVLSKDSLNYDAWKVAYNTYLKIDSTNLAIVYGNKLLKVDSTNAQYYFQVANLYLGNRQTVKAANFFTKSYRYLPLLTTLYLALGNYNNLALFDSVVFYSDSTFAGINYNDKEVLLMRAQAFDKRYKYDESYAVYNMLIKMGSTDSVVIAEQEIVQRKIAYLWRKKREQEQLADSLSNLMPIINF